MSILLGFAALLTQKKYLDAKTRRITELELPFFGKLAAAESVANEGEIRWIRRHNPQWQKLDPSASRRYPPFPVYELQVQNAEVGTVKMRSTHL